MVTVIVGEERVDARLSRLFVFQQKVGDPRKGRDHENTVVDL
jgi:hypothetical protein